MRKFTLPIIVSFLIPFLCSGQESGLPIEFIANEMKNTHFMLGDFPTDYEDIQEIRILITKENLIIYKKDGKTISEKHDVVGYSYKEKVDLSETERIYTIEIKDKNDFTLYYIVKEYYFNNDLEEIVLICPEIDEYGMLKYYSHYNRLY